MTAITYPPVFINEYLSEKIPAMIPEAFNGPLRFFPTLPTDPTVLTESFPESANDVFGVYDRMFKMRRKPFPHIKCEQLLYYFYALTEDAVENLIEMTQRIQDLLDNGDESAQDLNAWIASKASGTVDVDGILHNKVTFDGKDFLLPFFHELKIYQLEETRDIIDFGTARTYAGNKIIIDYEWHKSDSFA